MSAHCPACNSPIPHADINPQHDTALCRACNHSTSYSSLIHAPVLSLYTGTPDGCHIAIDAAGHWRALATTRSWRFFPTALYALFWTGILSLLTLGIIKSHGLPGLLFLSLHFVAALYLILCTLMYAMGDVEASIDPARNTITISTGIGPLRWTRSRHLADIRSIRQQTTRGRRSTSTLLILDAPTHPNPLRFGTLLTTPRRNFLHAAIAAKLHQRPQ